MCKLQKNKTCYAPVFSACLTGRTKTFFSQQHVVLNNENNLVNDKLPFQSTYRLARSIVDSCHVLADQKV